MNTVLVHPFAGVLSAYGMGLADVRALRERTIERRCQMIWSRGWCASLTSLR